MVWDFVFTLLGILTIVVEIAVILIIVALVVAIGYSVMNEGTEKQNDQSDNRQ